MANVVPSVFIVAGNRLLRETLARLLRKRHDLRVCGVSPLAVDLAPSVISSTADVLILDEVGFRFLDGAFIAAIVHQNPDIKVILVDMDADPDIFLKSVRAGAVGYLLMDASAPEVVSGVCDVALGRAVSPPELCVHLFRAYSRHCVAVPSARIKHVLGLTQRQQELVPLISQGLTNKEIASRLIISEHTVKNHIHEIMRRIGVRGRLQVQDVIDQTHLMGAAK
jgi:DNA-binding NarL/FixJ family response regulator